MFKIGDRVVCLIDLDTHDIYRGHTGTLIDIDTEEKNPLIVLWDDYMWEICMSENEIAPIDS